MPGRKGAKSPVMPSTEPELAHLAHRARGARLDFTLTA